MEKTNNIPPTASEVRKFAKASNISFSSIKSLQHKHYLQRIHTKPQRIHCLKPYEVPEKPKIKSFNYGKKPTKILTFVFAEMIKVYTNTGVCPSLAELSTITNSSPSTVRASLKWLDNHGYINCFIHDTTKSIVLKYDSEELRHDITTSRELNPAILEPKKVPLKSLELVYAHLDTYIEYNNKAPTIEELSSLTGYSIGYIHRLLTWLQCNGHISRVPWHPQLTRITQPFNINQYEELFSYQNKNIYKPSWDLDELEFKQETARKISCISRMVPLYDETFDLNPYYERYT